MHERSSDIMSLSTLSNERRSQVVAALVEGKSIRSTVRMTGVWNALDADSELVAAGAGPCLARRPQDCSWEFAMGQTWELSNAAGHGGPMARLSL